MDHIYQDALKRLERNFPPHFEEFDNPWIKSAGDPEDTDDNGVMLQLCHSIAVINLARTHNLLALLPSAFYLAAQVSCEVLIEGYDDDDGVTWRLSRQDLTKCIGGESKLRERYTQMLRFLFLPSEDYRCQNPACERVILARRKTQFAELWWDAGALFESAWIAGLGLCARCTDHYKKLYDDLRVKTWADLPSFFELDDWPNGDAE